MTNENIFTICENCNGYGYYILEERDNTIFIDKCEVCLGTGHLTFIERALGKNKNIWSVRERDWTWLTFNLMDFKKTLMKQYPCENIRYINDL